MDLLPEAAAGLNLCCGDVWATAFLFHRKVRPMKFPESRIRKAIFTDSASDMEKLVTALHKIEEEDPTLKVEQSAELRQTILHGQGQLKRCRLGIQLTAQCVSHS